jgi:hypothetical protein
VGLGFPYEEIGDLIRKHVAAYQVEMEKFLHLVVFNYLVHNGDAPLLLPERTLRHWPIMVLAYSQYGEWP